MSEDSLLRNLGHLAKDENGLVRTKFDERWDRLAAGTLTAEEEAELRNLAEESPDSQEAYEMFRPLGEEFQSRMVDRLVSEVEDRTPRREPRPRLLWFPRRMRAAGWAAGAAAAAAAGLLLLLRGLNPATLPPMPTYVAELSRGTQALRGEESTSAGPRVYEPGDKFGVVLRPATKTAGKGLEAQCFLLRSDQRRRLEVKVEIDLGGAVKIVGSIARDLQPGDWTLWTVVGRAGTLPDPTDLRYLDSRTEFREHDWVAVPKEIHIHSRSP